MLTQIQNCDGGTDQDQVWRELAIGPTEMVTATDDRIQTSLAQLLGSGVLTEEEAASKLTDQGIDLGYEKRWLDESIPALGGLTPREAAADPVGREELDQLLKSFPRPTPEFTGMDPDRIRETLGL